MVHSVNDWRVGLSVCYDVRFPAMYQTMCASRDESRFLEENNKSEHDQSISDSGLGAEVVLVPAAFTRKTGIAHWEVLLRARAIENQCYIIAAAQAGNLRFVLLDFYFYSPLILYIKYLLPHFYHFHDLILVFIINFHGQIIHTITHSGYHNEKRSSFGHSMIIDPWGRICKYT